jgi:hypothetical protein
VTHPVRRDIVGLTEDFTGQFAPGDGVLGLGLHVGHRGNSLLSQFRFVRVRFSVAHPDGSVCRMCKPAKYSSYIIATISRLKFPMA